MRKRDQLFITFKLFCEIKVEGIFRRMLQNFCAGVPCRKAPCFQSPPLPYIFLREIYRIF